MWQPWAAASLFILALAVVCHHWWIHPELRGWRRWAQLKDLDDHEDVWLALICVAAGILIGQS